MNARFIQLSLCLLVVSSALARPASPFAAHSLSRSLRDLETESILFQQDQDEEHHVSEVPAASEVASNSTSATEAEERTDKPAEERTEKPAEEYHNATTVESAAHHNGTTFESAEHHNGTTFESAEHHNGTTLESAAHHNATTEPKATKKIQEKPAHGLVAKIYDGSKGSCKDRCGVNALHDECYCDQHCDFYGDCCDDFELVCPGEAKHQLQPVHKVVAEIKEDVEKAEEQETSHATGGATGAEHEKDDEEPHAATGAEAAAATGAGSPIEVFTFSPNEFTTLVVTAEGPQAANLEASVSVEPRDNRESTKPANFLQML